MTVLKSKTWGIKVSSKASKKKAISQSTISAPVSSYIRFLVSVSQTGAETDVNFARGNISAGLGAESFQALLPNRTSVTKKLWPRLSFGDRAPAQPEITIHPFGRVRFILRAKSLALVGPIPKI